MSALQSSVPDRSIVIDLVRDLPLPAAVLHLHGPVSFANERLKSCFGVASLETGALREVISRSEPVWRALRLRTRAGEDVDVLAQSIRCTAGVVLLIDDTTDQDRAAEVEQLRQALQGEWDPLPIDDGSVQDVNDAFDTDARADPELIINAEVARSGHYKQPLSLLLVAVDGTAELDASSDHLGDLRRTLRSALRMADLLLRLEGDRFLVIAPVTDFRRARTLATGLRIMVEKHEFPELGQRTISIGVAEVLHEEASDGCLSRAMQALRSAQDEGGNRVVVDPRGRSDAWAASGESLPRRLIWQQAYECGDPLVDAQHRTLYDLTNELIQLSAGRADFQRVGATVERLLSHVESHFTDEEQLLDTIEYPFIGAHKAAHRELLQRAKRVVEQAGAQGEGYGAVVEFLTHDVVANHITGCDSDFFPLARARCGGQDGK